MNLLLTGAFQYNKEQLKQIESLGVSIIYIEDERIPLTIDVSNIDAVVCNGLFQYNNIKLFECLKYIQLTSVGYDRVPLDYINEHQIHLKNAKGVYSAPMAEWVILKILEIYKKSREFYQEQNKHKWTKQHNLLEVNGKVASIIGCGGIGNEIAKRLKALNATVIGFDITPIKSKWIDEIYDMNDLDNVLFRSDIVVLTLPLTDETYHLMNADKISLLKNNCILINISRGSIIDETALIEALGNQKFLGVALDVFEEEPLLSNSPLWDMDRVIITPHNSYESDKIKERLFQLIWNNLRAYITHKDCLPSPCLPYKICIVTTMSSSIDYWIKPFFQLYQSYNMNVSIVCNMSAEFMKIMYQDYPFLGSIHVAIPRGVNFMGSARAIFKLYQFFSKEKFDFVQYATPNASFYAAIASRLANIPIRVYSQWGMVFVSMNGFRRYLFQLIERTTCLLSTHIQPDSQGNLEYCRKNRFYSAKKSSVIWNGSPKGVDLKKYDISKKSPYREEIFSRYKIPEDSIVLGFVGRLGKDKGCVELFQAFRILNHKYKNLKLLFVGPMEKEETIPPKVLKWFYANKNIIKTYRVSDVEKHMAAMDIFILPSYREGFGMCVVEAQAMGVPVIVTNIPGPINGMIPNKTGLIIPVKNVKAIISATEHLIVRPNKRKDFGEKGRTYVRNQFDSKTFAEKLIENRLELMKGAEK